MKNIIIIKIPALLFLFLFLACQPSEKATESLTEKAETPPSDKHTENELEVVLNAQQLTAAQLVYGTFAKRNLAEVIAVSGYTNVPPQNTAIVSALIDGRVQSIAISEGDYVRKGQLLATVENIDFLNLQREYVSKVYQLNYTKKDYLRQKKLYEERVTSRKKYELAEANYQAERSYVNGLAEQLRQIPINPQQVSKGKFTKTFPILAPIDGYIGHIQTSIGSYVSLSETLFTIIDNTKIHLDLDIYEQDFPTVKIGQKVSFSLINQSDEVISAEIFAIGKSFEPDSKTIKAHARVDNTSQTLVANMFVNALIEIGDRQANTLPEEAIIDLNGKKHIFVIDKQTNEETHFKAIPVVTGRTTMGIIEVSPLGTLDPKTSIVVKNTYFIQSQLALNAGGGDDDH